MRYSTENAVKALMMMKCSDAADPNLDTHKTKIFKDSVRMKELSVRLSDAVIILRGHCETMNNRNATKLELRKSVASITKSVIPLVSVSAMFLSCSSTTFSAIPGSSRLVTPPCNIPARVVNIPPPVNGSSYKKIEVYSFLQPYNAHKRSVIRSKTRWKEYNLPLLEGS